MTDRRWAWAEVDLGAIADNVRALKARTSHGTRFMAVVKADAYGHGAVPVARAALAAGADRLGVATVDEALGLRAAGIDAQLHLLSEAPPGSEGDVVAAGLVATLFSREAATALSGAAASAGVAARFHLKTDTGMNRIGVRAEDAPGFVESLSGLPGLEMEGLFTHFATADLSGDWGFQKQVERFDAMLERMRERGIRTGIVHAANSAATVLHPATHHDMVRCGISIYGLHPSDATRSAVSLRPAMSVKARVSLVKRIPMGEGVSYGFTFHAPAPTTIATLPLGYADGVMRVLSDRMRVLIGGRECRQVGRICMDQLMVEVPRGLAVTVGDEAVLVGSQGGLEVTTDEQAGLAGTINYEIACGYGLRLERVLVG